MSNLISYGSFIPKPENNNKSIVTNKITSTSLKINTNDGKNYFYFALFDGFNGSFCSEFLRDNLHKFITKSTHFPSDIKKAVKEGF